MRSCARKTSFFCSKALESCVPAHENTYKKHFFASFFLFLIRRFLKKWIIFYSSYACSIFPKSREVPYRGFLGMAHLPVSLLLPWSSPPRPSPVQALTEHLLLASFLLPWSSPPRQRLAQSPVQARAEPLLPPPPSYLAFNLLP